MFKLSHGSKEVTSGEISFDGRHLAIGFEDGSVKIKSFITKQIEEKHSTLI